MRKILFRLLSVCLVVCFVVCAFTACKEEKVNTDEYVFEIKYINQYSNGTNKRILFSFVYTQEMFDYIFYNNGRGYNNGSAFLMTRQIVLNDDPLHLHYDEPRCFNLFEMYGISYSTVRDHPSLNDRIVNFKVGEDVYFNDYFDVGNYNLHFEIKELNLAYDLYLEVK